MLKSLMPKNKKDSVEYHDAFPWRLEHGDTVCGFQCKEHLQKYLDRYRLKPRNVHISHKDGESFESRKKHKTDVQSSTRKSNHRGTSSVRKRKSSMDSIRNTVSDAKGTKCLKKSKTKN